MTPKNKDKFLEYLGITEEDLDKEEYNPNFDMTKILNRFHKWLTEEVEIKMKPKYPEDWSMGMKASAEIKRIDSEIKSLRKERKELLMRLSPEDAKNLERKNK